MGEYERCKVCREVVNFTIDKMGRVGVVCPVCDEGRAPYLTESQKLAIQRQTSHDTFCAYDICGQPFERTEPNQKYCCAGCADAERAVYEKCGGHALARYLLDIPARRCGDGVYGCGLLFKPITHHQVWCGVPCREDSKRRKLAKAYALKRIAKREAREAAARQQDSAA